MKSRYKTNLICIRSGAPLSEAKDIMQERRIRHLPVINEQQEIIGIISQHDLTDDTKYRDLPVDLFASSPVEYVTNHTPLRQVALAMLTKKISCVLIADEFQEVTGILTTDDMLYQLSEMLKTAEEASPEALNEPNSILSVRSLITIGEVSRNLSAIGI